MNPSPRVPRVTGTLAGVEFEGFYATHFGDTVAMIYRLTTDIDEARDISQEAFCRAWHRWHQISDYDNPITWVRRVATNLAYSRFRHLRVASTHLRRHRADDAAVAPPSLDHLTIVAGLRKLPRDQCIALVLHHMLDLPVTQVADALDVPVGRVKTWLYRGRQTLGVELGMELGMHVKPRAVNDMAPTEQTTTKHRQGRQRTHKTVTRAAALLLTILATFTAINAAQSIRQRGNELAARSVQPSQLMKPAAVTLAWRAGNLTVQWNDPSDGYAQPFLISTGSDTESHPVAAPAKGDTQAILTGLSPTGIYCVTVFLLYADNSFMSSDRVCTGQPPARRFGRFEAQALV